MAIFRQISWWLSRESIERKRKCCGESSQQSEGESTSTFVTSTFSLLKATSLLKSHQAASWAVLALHFPLFLMLWHLNNGWLFLPCVSNNLKSELVCISNMMRMLYYLNIIICNASSHIVHLTQLEQFLMSPCKTPALLHCNALLKPWCYNAS